MSERKYFPETPEEKHPVLSGTSPNELKNKCMKILVSSKSMAQTLFFLEVKDHEVKNVELNRNNLTIRTGYNFQVVPVEVIGEPDYSLIIQANRRWDHIQDLLMIVPEQPVVIEIRVQVVSVIFQY
jgi:hypothetical protein